MKAILSLFLVVGLAVQAFPEERTSVAAGIPGQEKAVTKNFPSTAEEYLSRLAKRNRSQRMIFGTIFTTVGAAGVATSFVLLGQKEDALGFNHVFGILFLVNGASSLADGTISLVFPTQAERAWASIRDIQDSAERERLSLAALPRLAKIGRKNRMITGGLITAVAVLTAATADEHSSDNMVAASLLGGLALHTFLSKSAEEKAYSVYLENKPQKTAPELLIGLTPRGGVWVSLAVEF